MFKKVLLVPFHSNVIVSNIVFAVLFSFLIWGSEFAGMMGMFMLPAIMVFSAMFFQYCFDIGHDAVMKAEDPPVYHLKTINYQSIFFTLIIISLHKAALYYLGVYTGSIVVSLVIPAILSSLIVEEQIGKAINPVEWIGYIWQLKLRYVFLVAILATSSLLLSLVPSGLWLLPKLFILQTIFIWSFYSLGISLHVYQDDLKIQTLETNTQKQVNFQRQQIEKQFTHITDAWHRLSEVHKFDEALNAITHYIEQQQADIQLIDKIMKELCSWRQTGLAVKFLPYYLEKMTLANKAAIAYAKYRLLCSKHGTIEIEDPQIQESMLQFAMEMGDNDIVDALS